MGDEKKMAPVCPRTVIVPYAGSDFNVAITEAREVYGEKVAVIAIPAGCRLLLEKRMPKKRSPK